MKKRLLGLLTACALLLGAFPAAMAAGEQTYTVTANLIVPGELNTQLPGVTAYVSNPNNPLGIVPEGYDSVEAVAPTEPVSNNATVTVAADGTLTLQMNTPNPVFTLQSIGGCSNAEVTAAPRDSQTYANADGSASREGRITSLTVQLKDRSGTYVFNDCKEFPTLLGVEWTVPLTLSVDLSGVPEAAAQPGQTEETAPAQGTETPAPPAVNYDQLKAVIKTVEQAEQEAKVSEDGGDVSPSKTWVTQGELDTLKAALTAAKAAMTAETQAEADGQAAALQEAYQTFVKAQKSGKGQPTDHLGKTLAPGTYTISANIWFNKADTGLPLNPHITNSTFPPMNPVADNAELTVNDDGSAVVVIPVCIKDRVMTIRELHGLNLTDTQRNEDGAITQITVELDALTGDSTVVTMQGEDLTADIWMGDLAMTISGLDKEHTWPFTFELNLSNVDTTDGGKMPVVELEMLDASAAAGAMAAAGVSSDVLNGTAEEPDEAEEPAEAPAEAEGESHTGVIAAVVIAVAAAAGAGYAVLRKKKGGNK